MMYFTVQSYTDILFQQTSAYFLSNSTCSTDHNCFLSVKLHGTAPRQFLKGSHWIKHDQQEADED